MGIDCYDDKSARKKIARTAEFFHLLGEENRLRILCVLRGGERCVCEIVPKLDLPQNLLSHHLSKLKTAGIIQNRKDGARIYYSLTEKGKEIAENIFKTITTK